MLAPTRTRAALPALLWLALLAASACGQTAVPPDAGMAGPDAGAVGLARLLEDCKLLGSFRVVTAPTGCEDWPRLDEVVSISVEGETAFLRAGLVEVPLGEVSATCEALAAGCVSGALRYFAPSFELSRTDTGLRLVARAVDVADGRVGPCREATFEAKPVEPCEPTGRYQAPAAATLTTGACDLAWPAGSVIIGQSGDTFSVDWAGTRLTDLSLDEETCTLKGSKGEGSSWWFYNGASRTVTLELKVQGDSLQGGATDELEGTTTDGKSCAGGTFALAANRPQPRAAPRLEASCPNPPPPACGNGVCEAGEDCFCADCTCASGQECAPDKQCRKRCTVLTEAADCGSGRCSPIKTGSCRTIQSSDRLYCDVAGTASLEQPCSCNSDCAAGLVCHVPAKKTAGLCAPPCGTGFPDCADGAQCAVQGDGSGSGWYPEAQRACEFLAGFGGNCSLHSCESGLSCMKRCINSACREFCTRSCSSSSCGPELPVCDASFKMCVPAD
ncbi:MAG: hypothetical protein QM765_22360 [Myxococcales bacterium]